MIDNDEREALSTVIAKIREGFYPEGLSAVSNDDLAHAILAAGFRRTDVPEPSAPSRAFGTVVTRADTAFELGRQAGRSEPQGEPSEAQVEAAITASWGDESWKNWHPTEVRDEKDCMRAALRAAAAVTDQGETR